MTSETTPSIFLGALESITGSTAKDPILHIVVGNCLVALLLFIAYWNYQLAIFTIWPVLWALLASIALYPIKANIVRSCKRLREEEDASLFAAAIHGVCEVCRLFQTMYINVVEPVCLPILAFFIRFGVVGGLMASLCSKLLFLQPLLLRAYEKETERNAIAAAKSFDNGNLEKVDKNQPSKHASLPSLVAAEVIEAPAKDAPNTIDTAEQQHLQSTKAVVDVATNENVAQETVVPGRGEDGAVISSISAALPDEDELMIAHENTAKIAEIAQDTAQPIDSTRVGVLSRRRGPLQTLFVDPLSPDAVDSLPTTQHHAAMRTRTITPTTFRKLNADSEGDSTGFDGKRATSASRWCWVSLSVGYFVFIAAWALQENARAVYSICALHIIISFIRLIAEIEYAQALWGLMLSALRAMVGYVVTRIDAAMRGIPVAVFSVLYTIISTILSFCGTRLNRLCRRCFGLCTDPLVACFLLWGVLFSVAGFAYFSSRAISTEWHHFVSDTSVRVANSELSAMPGYTRMAQYVGAVEWQAVNNVIDQGLTWADTSVDTTTCEWNHVHLCSMPEQASMLRSLWQLVQTLNDTLTVTQTANFSEPFLHNITDVTPPPRPTADVIISVDTPPLVDPCAVDASGVAGMLGYLSVSCLSHTVADVSEWWTAPITDSSSEANTKPPSLAAGLEALLQEWAEVPGFKQLTSVSAAISQATGFDRVWEHFSVVGYRLLAVALQLFAFVASASLAFFSTVLSFTLFCNLSYHLLSKEHPWHDVLLQAIRAEGVRRSLSSDLMEPIRQIFVMNMKMCIFHILFTFLWFSAFGVHFVYTAVTVAAIGAVVPLFPVWAIAVPGAIELAYTYDLWIPAVFALSYWLITTLATWSMYEELKNNDPYVLGLAILAGIYAFGLQGALVGPVLVTIFIASYRVVTRSLGEASHIPQSAGGTSHGVPTIASATPRRRRQMQNRTRGITFTVITTRVKPRATAFSDARSSHRRQLDYDEIEK